MKKLFITLAGLTAAGILVVGCNSSTKITSQEKSLFENSTPDIKHLFDAAQAAERQGNFLSAYTNYQALLNQKLSVDQSMVMQTLMDSLAKRVYAAADKGNPDAEAVIKYSQSQPKSQIR